MHGIKNKTSDLIKLLHKNGKKKFLIVCSSADKTQSLKLAINNIPLTDMIFQIGLNVYDILNKDQILFTELGLKDFENRILNAQNNKKSNLVDLNKSYKIILKPLVTEKATKLSEFNKVVFAVSLKSNKIEIKNAIEKLFSVKVKSVNIVNIKGKLKRFKGVLGRKIT